MKSLVSYPERGAGGNNRYRGNCSPKLVEDLIDQFRVQEICDYMAGSYTTAAAAETKGISSHCYDLNHGFDLMTMEIPERSEFIFWHPPYWDIVRYSDSQYSAADVMQRYGIDPRINDLSRARTWEEFIKMQNFCMMKLFASLEVGGRLAVLMGDIKKKGQLYSQLCEIVKPGKLEQIVIKAQHNCMSDQNVYSGRFIPIVHEYVMIVQKEYPLVYDFLITARSSVDARNMRGSTWLGVVKEVMMQFGQPVSLAEIYAKIEGHKKAQKNPHWKEKVRQTLNSNAEFLRIERGIWSLAQ